MRNFLDLRRLLIAALTGIAAALMLTSCAQGVTRDNLVAAFVENNPDASTAEAQCVVDRLIGQYDLSELEVELTAAVLAPSFEEAQFRSMFVCGIEGDVGQQITEQLTANGVAAEDAPCVSERLVGEMTDSDIDVLLSGEITDDFYAKFFAAMEACGAVE